MGGWVMVAGPSITFGRINPCQWTVVVSGNRLVTLIRTRSPWRKRSVGPGTCPLNAYALTETVGRICHRMTDVSRSKTLTPFSMRGESGCAPCLLRSYVAVTSRGSTAAMSSIAAAGVSSVMIMPGGMIAPRTSWALSRRLTTAAGKVIPAASMNTVNSVIATNCVRVTSACMPDPPAMVTIS